MGNNLCFIVADRSYFAILKKEIRALATEAGIIENKIAELDIVVAEIVSNLVKHGNGGKLLVKLVTEQGIQGIELISIDNGAGISDLTRMMKDGMSTTNTLGQGLGAIKRLSDVFQVYTQKDWGTVLLSRVFNEEPPYQRKGSEIRSVIVPKPGETACGDGFYYSISQDEVRLFIGDGLGHGHEASAAVNAAINAFKLSKETSAVESIREVHSQVKKTRGLVGTIALFNIKEKTWRICGVGNIATRLLSGIEIKNYMSYNGIIGYNIPNTMKDQEAETAAVQVMIMCSDGIKTKWDLLKYPGILRFDLSILAAVIFKDYSRQTDDMSVVAVRLNF